jgi:aminoglycoside phosphotransferase (APT) family kinase protein
MHNSETQDDLRPRLEAFLRSETNADVDVNELQPLPGGASRDTWLVFGVMDNKSFSFVLRRDLESSMIDNALTREQEFRVLSAAHAAGVKVPKPRFFSSIPAVLGKPFFLMDYIEGVSIGPRVVRDPRLQAAREALPEQLAQQLAIIHSLDTTTLNFLPRPADGLSPALDTVAQLKAMLDSMEVYNPTLEYGLRWVERHAPPTAPMTVVHGDYRVGNLLVGQDGLNAIIDWEFTRIGDPHEDIAWLCLRDWRFGNGAQQLGGIAEREPFVQVYEKFSQRNIHRKRLDYWEIVGNLRWAVTCLSQAQRHLVGGDTSVEYASLGRRSAEMQLEMLRLIAAYHANFDD